VRKIRDEGGGRGRGRGWRGVEGRGDSGGWSGVRQSPEKFKLCGGTKKDAKAPKSRPKEARRSQNGRQEKANEIGAISGA